MQTAFIFLFHRVLKFFLLFRENLAFAKVYELTRIYGTGTGSWHEMFSGWWMQSCLQGKKLGTQPRKNTLENFTSNKEKKEWEETKHIWDNEKGVSSCLSLVWCPGDGHQCGAWFHSGITQESFQHQDKGQHKDQWSVSGIEMHPAWFAPANSKILSLPCMKHKQSLHFHCIFPSTRMLF